VRRSPERPAVVPYRACGAICDRFVNWISPANSGKWHHLEAKQGMDHGACNHLEEKKSD
jgi:hypothetical protein